MKLAARRRYQAGPWCSPTSYCLSDLLAWWLAVHGLQGTDSSAHTVTGQRFDSGDLQHGKTFSHQFTSADTYTYHCSIHAFVTGTVVVQ